MASSLLSPHLTSPHLNSSPQLLTSTAHSSICRYAAFLGNLFERIACVGKGEDGIETSECHWHCECHVAP